MGHGLTIFLHKQIPQGGCHLVFGEGGWRRHHALLSWVTSDDNNGICVRDPHIPHVLVLQVKVMAASNALAGLCEARA